jgi:hypothetical protein
MVQIATAEQSELKRSVATSIPLLEPGMGIFGPIKEDGTLEDRIIIDAMAADEFACKSLALRGNPDKGWDLETSTLEEARTESLRGVIPDSVRVIGQMVEIKINDFTPPAAKNPRQIAEYIGPLAAFRGHRAG